jgi:hypothetical protein
MKPITLLLLLLCSAVVARAAAAAPATPSPLHALRAQRSASDTTSTTAAAPKVKVEFYGESLCPYCIKFTLEQLAALFETGLADIIDLQYIASGNARPSSDGSGGIVCQHGPLVRVLGWCFELLLPKAAALRPLTPLTLPPPRPQSSNKIKNRSVPSTACSRAASRSRRLTRPPHSSPFCTASRPPRASAARARPLVAAAAAAAAAMPAAGTTSLTSTA